MRGLDQHPLHPFPDEDIKNTSQARSSSRVDSRPAERLHCFLSIPAPFEINYLPLPTKCDYLRRSIAVMLFLDGFDLKQGE